MEDVNMDNILELDDVLPDLTPVTMGPMRHDTPATAVPRKHRRAWSFRRASLMK